MHLFIQHCLEKGYDPSYAPSFVTAQFLCARAATSERPKSLLNTCSAAIGCLSRATDVPNMITDELES